MLGVIWKYFDIVYLVLWGLSKVERKVSWEKPATVAIYMAVPLQLSIEFVMLLTEQWNGIGMLGSLVPNRIGYVILVFVPIWMVVVLMFGKANRHVSPEVRLARLRETTTSVVRGSCTVAYFALPAVALLSLVVVTRQSG